jgi:GTPase SAR1 family protein
MTNRALLPLSSDFALKTIKWGTSTLVYLQLWDIAGQERYGNLTRVYYKEAVAAFVVFDLTRNSSFESVKRWKDDIDNVRDSHLHISSHTRGAVSSASQA